MVMVTRGRMTSLMSLISRGVSPSEEAWEGDTSIAICSEPTIARAWCDRLRGTAPRFVCVAGFTATAMIDRISAAGLTPHDRLLTANADLDFLVSGNTHDPLYPLPPLVAGASPVLITRAIASELHWPIHAINAGLPYALSQPSISLHSPPARCVSSGRSLDPEVVERLFSQGLELGRRWGPASEAIGADAAAPWLMIGECVVGGTTTALGVLTALGIEASGLISSSLVQCDRGLKDRVVRSGLAALARRQAGLPLEPIAAIAAMGDPMQPVVAGMTLGAIEADMPVLLAGGTQMLAVWELARRLAAWGGLTWRSDRVVVGTTRWVIEDATAGAVQLARSLGAPLIASRLNLSASRHPTLRAYEQGYVKEGVGAGGAAIGATVHQGWDAARMVRAIDQLADSVGASVS
jgi:uncharacterized protein (TIGR00303 family)